MKRKAKPYAGALLEPIPMQYFHLSPQEQARFIQMLHWNVALKKVEGGLDEVVRYMGEIDTGKMYRDGAKAFQIVLGRNREEKLPILLSHFGVQEARDGSHWKELALELAVRHVPGFKTCRSKGAPSTGAFRDTMVGMRVLRKLKRNPGKSVNWACENIGKDYPDMKDQRSVHRAYYRWKKTELATRLVALEKKHPKLCHVFLDSVLDTIFPKGPDTFSHSA